MFLSHNTSMGKRVRLSNFGFTLIEIIVVLILVGLLTGLALPKFRYSMERVRAGEGVNLLTALRAAQSGYFTEFQTYTLDPTQLDITVDGSAYFNVPTIGGTAAAPTLSIQRSDTTYTLTMVMDGTVTCADGGSNACESIGY